MEFDSLVEVYAWYENVLWIEVYAWDGIVLWTDVYVWDGNWLWNVYFYFGRQSRLRWEISLRRYLECKVPMVKMFIFILESKIVRDGKILYDDT